MLIIMKLAFPPNPLIMLLLSFSSSHPLTAFQINLLYVGHEACFIGGDWSIMLFEKFMLVLVGDSIY